MPRSLYCAQCGLEIWSIKRAFQKQVIDFIEPHECLAEMVFPEGISAVIPKPKPIMIEAEFDKFKLVQKLNDLKKDMAATTPMDNTIPDHRPKEFHRQEIGPQGVPAGIASRIKTMLGTQPANIPIDLDESED